MYLNIDKFLQDILQILIWPPKIKVSDVPKAELLQLKLHPFICMRNFINKKVGNRKN